MLILIEMKYCGCWHYFCFAVAGSIGQNLKNISGKSLPRITALDPANPCFNSATDLKGLTRDDAKIVDVIHTNAGGLGKRDPIGKYNTKEMEFFFWKNKIFWR